MIISIRSSIANIYRTLRNICGLIMLAGLIYTGIKILLSANIPTKKQAWLGILQDWLIGMILLIFSHVIMVGIFYISDTLTDAISLATSGMGGLNIKLISECLKSFDSAEQLICLIMLGYLIYLTVVFAVSYFKRLLWVCVLIVFAPVVSVMYAFGQQTKQIYSKWLREYITTVLVQPFHLIVYWVLVSIPLNIANSSGEYGWNNSFEIIYALVAISFIRPAESYIRSLFGMNQGIANMASFDSGKQTIHEIKVHINKAKEKVAEVVKVGATVAGAAFGGPVGAKIGNDVGSAIEQGVKKQGSNSNNNQSDSMNKLLGAR